MIYQKNDADLRQVVLHLQGRFDIISFNNSLNLLFYTNDVLREYFLRKKRKINAFFKNISCLADEQKERFIENFKRNDREKGFGDPYEPFIRFSVLQTDHDRYSLICSYHWTRLDEWSLRILIRKLFELYGQRDSRQTFFAEKSPSGKSFELITEHNKEGTRQYWKKYLHGYEQLASIPIQRRADGNNSNQRMEELVFQLDTDLTNKLSELAEKYQVSLASAFQTVWGILLQRYSNSEDVVFGTMVSECLPAGAVTEKVAGLFVNPAPVRVRSEQRETFVNLLKKVDQAVRAFESHKCLSLADIEESTCFSDHLVDHIIAFEAVPVEKGTVNTRKVPGAPELKVTDIQIFEQAHYDFQVRVRLGEEFVVKFTFNNLVYSPEFVETMAEHFQQIISLVVAYPNHPADDLEIVTETEKFKLLTEFNHTEAVYPREKTIHELFEEQVAKTPENIAVVSGEQMLTYRELNKQANQLARILRKKGVQREEIVGLLVENSLAMFTGILGILKAGGAYLPIDPRYPAERIAYMLRDSGTRLLLTGERRMPVPEDYSGEILSLDEAWDGEESSNLDKINQSRDLAYVIYTSGSTGNPKGVMVEHRSLMNLASWHNRYYQVTPQDRSTKLAGVGFDASVWEIFPYLITGASVYIIPEPLRHDLEALNQYYEEQGITISFLPTQLAELFMELENRSLRVLLVGGDHLHRVRDKNYLIVNNYGPTENTVVTTSGPVDSRLSVLPIGRPIANNCVYILNRHYRLQPIGVPGELCIAGESLARGYLNRPELTAEKFVPDPFAPGERMYKTGDLVRWLPDGRIEYLGRIDDQVKIRGYRIELGEIETQLLNHETVQEAVVTARTDKQGAPYLCAYAVVNRDWNVNELRHHLARTLPDYMVPSCFVELQTMPLTANGKVDKKRLPEPGERVETGAAYVAPTTSTEKILAGMWRDVLGIEHVGIHDHFLELGGHSLKAMMLAARIQKGFGVKLSVREVFASPTIQELADYINNWEGQAFETIEPAGKRDFYPVSSAQKRLYVMQQLEGIGCTYHTPSIVEVKGPLDIDRLQSAFASFVERHEALRTSFHFVGGELMQKIHPWVHVNITKMEAANEEEVNRLIESFIRPFDLNRVPLFRVGLIKMEEERHVLVIDMHHIISDGVSMGILHREIGLLYQWKSLPELRVQYKDYAVWQQHLMQTERFKEQEKYWLKQLSGGLTAMELPADHPRPPVQQFTGEKLEFKLCPDLTRKIKQLGTKQGVTLYMTLLASYQLFLSKYTDQENIVVGTMVAGRSHADFEPVFGMFVNTLVLKSNVTGNQTFCEFLASVKEQVYQAHEHADYPFDELVEKLDARRDLSRNPLFDTAFVLQNMDIPGISIPELTITPYEWEWKKAMFDLTWEAVEKETLQFSVEYNTCLFRRTTVERMISHFTHILEQIADQPQLSLSEVELVTESERHQLLMEFNDTAAYYPREKTIHELFEEQVEKTPENIAVVFGEKQLTYRQLNTRANQLARVLREKGIKREQIAGILVDRSLDMFVGILGILKAGGAYLPIDPKYPSERINQMLEDSGSRLLLTQKHIKIPEGYTGERWVIDDEKWQQGKGSNLEKVNRPHDLAYVIYTSGSTGQPKGVMVEHHSLVNLATWHNRYYQVTEQDRSTKFAGFGFDASVWEIFPYLLAGASIYVIEDGIHYDLKALNQYYEEHGITISFLPTQLSEQFMELDNRSLRTLLVGGDQLHRVQAKNYRIVNNYGPTENTVVTTCCQVDPYATVLPIGRPIANNHVYILNGNRQLQPVGVTGELCISGESLARGYLNRPGLTSEKFVPNPFVPGERMYRTGDLARWLPDGNIEYLGRIDDQVKIRGYRIELGEIEAQLLKHHAVREAVVMAHADDQGESYLCAYVVVQGEWTISGLRQHLGLILPDYMIPSYFLEVKEFPITANGKVDRKALPNPGERMMTKSQYAAPTNRTEEILVQIWEEALKVERVGIHDNFFELGGDSIKAIQVAARLYHYNRKLNMNDLFQYPTISELAPFVKMNQTVAEQGIITGEVVLTPIQQWFFEQKMSQSHHWNQAVMLHSRENWDHKAVQQAFQKLVEHHDVLRMVYSRQKQPLVQQIRGVGEEHFTLQVFDFTREADVRAQMEREANKLQRSICLEQGPLVRLALFLTGEGNYLLIIIHHLVVDGVSWRILLEDFATAYQYALKQEEILLPAKTTSFQTWAKKLTEYANGKELLKELDYWQEVEQMVVPELPKDRDGIRSYLLKDSDTIRISLTEEKTNQLLTHVHRAYLTEINDLLLTALGLTIQEWTRQNLVAVHLEGHGREEIIKGMDLTRTIGWFTSVYPVVFDLKSSELPRAIKSVKETLRQVPNKGIGYGILKYLTDPEQKKSMVFRLHPEISFNYLGQFDQYMQIGGFDSATAPIGDCFNPLTPTYPLEINGLVVEGRMEFSFCYNQLVYHRKTIERLVLRYKYYLLRIIDHCLKQEESTRTPSDFSASKLSLEEWEEFLETLE
ncbi:non-ribosomal peptide synthetase [Paenactinomyces guangxiensis]|nr:non-ribosomal peptide synthetase [Paenactinomyces guangxiensis]